jgi:hypothetical protein
MIHLHNLKSYTTLGKKLKIIPNLSISHLSTSTAKQGAPRESHVSSIIKAIRGKAINDMLITR